MPRSDLVGRALDRFYGETSNNESATALLSPASNPTRSLEELKIDGQSMIAGRPIHLDVAQAPSRGGQSSGRSNSFAGQQQSSRSNSFGPDSGGGVDGSKFQGGRHNKQGGGGGSF